MPGRITSESAKGLRILQYRPGVDNNYQLYDNVTVAGWLYGYEDAGLRLLPETTRLIPFEDDLPLIMGKFVGVCESLCPRGVMGSWTTAGPSSFAWARASVIAWVRSSLKVFISFPSRLP